MTPPIFHIGDEVEIIGPSCGDSPERIGEKFAIKQILNENGEIKYSCPFQWWYPASSLRLVYEEPKVGDYATVLVNGCGVKKDTIIKISKILEERVPGDEGPYYTADKMPLWNSHELRKLTPEEILCHLTSREPISIEARLSSIEKQLAEMKDTYTEDGRYEAKTICDIKERLCVLEGERPEVCECKQPLSHIASLAAMASFGPVPECVAAFIRHESEEAEKRKRDCKPNDELILISIQRGEEMHTDAIQCPAEAIAWCEKVLDSMRSDKP